MNKPLVSILIRTCGRPKVLKRALESVREQVYSNIEVVVIEDGENISEQLIRGQFSDLNIVYKYTGNKQGRCIVGNLALESAHGEYLNFLDDDDILLPCHVQVLVEALEGTTYGAAYAMAEEQQIKIKDSAKYTFEVKRKLVRYKHPFNRLLLCYMNYIPIQSILFRRELYMQNGGFDVNLDLLEDWDLWLRYAMVAEYLFVPQITSVYYTPYRSKKKTYREIDLHKSEDVLKKKHASYLVSLDANAIQKDVDYLLNVFNKKGILFYLQKVRNYLLYRDI